MTITIRLKTGNAAFSDPDAGEKDRDAQEYARELRSITARTAHREKQIINGNAARAWFARKPDRTA